MSVLTIDLATASYSEVETAYLRLEAALQARSDDDHFVTMLGHDWIPARTQVVRADFMREGPVIWAEPAPMNPENMKLVEAVLAGTYGRVGPDSYRLPGEYANMIATTDRQVVGDGLVRFYRGDELVAVVTQCREDSDPDGDIFLPRPASSGVTP
jgi:hypothetical protein